LSRRTIRSRRFGRYGHRVSDAYVPSAEAEKKGSRLKAVARWTAADSTAPTWAGLVVAALGFGLLAFGWGRVAGLTNVALQLPYVVSAGFTGLGLIAVGCTLVSVQARRQDAVARDRRLAELGEVLEVLEKLSSAPAPVAREEEEEAPARRPAPRRAPARSTSARRPRSAGSR
jgi:hypothetical protein